MWKPFHWNNIFKGRIWTFLSYVDEKIRTRWCQAVNYTVGKTRIQAFEPQLFFISWGLHYQAGDETDEKQVIFSSHLNSAINLSYHVIYPIRSFCKSWNLKFVIKIAKKNNPFRLVAQWTMALISHYLLVSEIGQNHTLLAVKGESVGSIIARILSKML